MSGGLKALLYIVSFFIPVVGIIIGIVWMTDHDPEKKSVGKTCIILGLIMIVLSFIFWFALFALSVGPVITSGY
ncbi:hypothetical protein ACIFOT_14445 [Neobacillus sp. NRS-1170]|uniref:hypothetical protein n=1 Tax=Neobacillus sp. NRS-1170 TaxID=3233898 RepID=UPI003D292703